MRRSITLSDPAKQWEVEVAGSEEFVLELAQRLGLYIKRLPTRSDAVASPPAGVPATTVDPVPGSSRPFRPADAPAGFVQQPLTDTPAPLEEQGDSDEDLSVEGFYRSFLGSRDPASLSADDLVVLFGYYLQHYMGKESWSALDITTCFTMAGLAQPRNMIGMLSTLARQKGSITPESPGEYSLSDRSWQMLELALRG